MSIPNDEELRARFAELRAFDGQSRPDFEAVVARGEQRAVAGNVRRTRAPIWIAAAAGIVVAIGVAGLAWQVRKLSPPSSALISQESITSWRSPTASLLRTPGRELYAPPELFTSVIDGASRAPVQRKGDGS